MARRGATSRYAALLTLLLVASGAAGRALRQDESPELSPEDGGDWSPPPESPEPEASPASDGSGGGATDIAPFVAAVMKGDEAFCSGALIAPSVVLTSAHCVVGNNNKTEELWLRIGWPDLKASTAAEGAEERGVSQTIVHPSWYANPHPAKESSDLALLVLDSPSEIAPIKLPAKGLKVGPGTAVWNAGYSVSSAGGSETMARVDLKTLDREECRSTFDGFWEVFYKATDAILELQMCTTGEVEGQATCRGDSGGPLVLGEGEEATLIGVLAWGNSGSCDNPKPNSVDFWSSLLNAGNRQWVEEQLSSLGTSSTSSSPSSSPSSSSPAPDDSSPAPDGDGGDTPGDDESGGDDETGGETGWDGETGGDTTGDETGWDGEAGGDESGGGETGAE